MELAGGDREKVGTHQDAIRWIKHHPGAARVTALELLAYRG